MNRTQLRSALAHHFNLDELRILCFDLKIAHENFRPTLDPFILDLITFCERSNTTHTLIAACRNQRPDFGAEVNAAGAIFANVPSLEKTIVGRDELIAGLVAQLTHEHARALSAEGMGGVGKTTLALVLAHHPRLHEHFADGVLWAGLGQQGNTMSALAAWAEALGLDVTPLLEPADRAREVQRAIGSRKMLLVIDDAWSLEAALYLKCGGEHCCHLLTTRDTHIAKQFAQGNVSKVPPLTDDAAFTLLQHLAPEACATDPAAARALAQRVGGLPLALEVLGGYLAIPEHSEFPELSAEALQTLSDPRQRLQLATQRLGDPRALSLQTVLTLSLNDLPEAAQTAWHALGAFAHKPATFSLAAAKAVCACDAATLASFVRRNLLEKVEAETLALHQTLADVARVNATALDEATQRHRQFYVDLANKDRNDWQTIEAVYEQIKFAWENAPQDETTLALIGATRIYQTLRGLWHDQIAWIEQGIMICQAAGNREEEATLLNNIGAVYYNLGNREKALAYYERALPIQEAVGGQVGQAATLSNIGSIHWALGEREKALAYYERALPIQEAVGDRAGQATTLNNIGRVYDDLGDREKALAYFERALPIREAVGDRAGQATTLNNIGMVYRKLGDNEKALVYYERALPISEAVGDRAGEAVTGYNIAMVFRDEGRLQEAVAQLERTVTLDEQVQHPDLESDRALLAQVRAELAARSGGPPRASDANPLP